MSWTLVIFIYAGVWAKGDNVSLTNVTGFSSKAACEVAAQQAEGLVSGTMKASKTICVEVK